MLKMTDVLEQSLVQDFTHAFSSCSAVQLDEKFSQSILNASETALKDMVAQFCQRQDAVDIAQALDIQDDVFSALQQGIALQSEYVIETQKIAAFCLALETNMLDQIEIADSLQDYPM